MDRYDDLTPRQSTFLQEFVARCREESEAWFLSVTMGSDAALVNPDNNETWEPVPGDLSFYEELSDQGFLGMHYGGTGTTFIYSTAQARAFAKYAARDRVGRGWAQFRHHVLGDQPWWATLAVAIGGGALTLLGQWLLHLMTT